MNSNPNSLETKKELYISQKTKLFVNKNGKMTPAVFDSFDQKNGKDVIYLICEGKRCFYYFPDSKYVFLNKDDCNIAVSKATRKNEVVLLTGRIVSAFNKFPEAKKPLQDYAKEAERETAFHVSVNRKLLDDKAEPERKIAEEAENIRTLNTEYAQNAKDAFEDGSFVDEHTMISFNLHKKSAEQNLSVANDEIRRIEEIRKQPYFARVDCGKSTESLHTAYIGETDIAGFIVDWRNSQIGNAYYHTEILAGRDDAVVALKRRFDIKNAEFKGFYDELNAYSDKGISDLPQNSSKISGDEMLTQLLAESREDKHTHDIIKTIQSEQYDIITSDFNQNAVINGCAGSGKTMIMYHRLSYMAYNYETYTNEEFMPENVYVISPSSYFDTTNNSLLKKLSIEKINQSPFVDLVDKLISEYCKLHGIIPLQGLSLYLNAKSDLENDFYTKKSYNYFSSQVADINFKSSKRDEYKKWVVSLANRFLEIAGFDVISPDDFFKAPSEVFKRFDSDSYFRNSCFEKTRKNKDGKEVQYGYFNKTSITGISFENISESLELSDIDSDTYKRRKRRLERNSGILKACLSVKTKYDSKGDVSTNIPDFWNLLEKSEVFEKMLSLIVAERLLNCISDTTRNQDLILKCLFVYEKTISSKYAKDICLYIMRVLSDKYGCAIDDKSFIFIDEFQNYSAFEIKCIDEAFLEPVYNLYGDFDQRIEEKGSGLKNDLDSLISPNTYNININYRNARPITEFINKAVHKNMHPIGVDGGVSENLLRDCSFNAINRTAIIAKDTELALRFLKKYIDISRINNVSKTREIQTNYFNLLNVSECKGLEFDTVYVFDYLMSDNERYVAFTRALDTLIVIKDALSELIKQEEQQKKEEARKRREEKKKLKEITKLVFVLEVVGKQKSKSAEDKALKETSAPKKTLKTAESQKTDMKNDATVTDSLSSASEAISLNSGNNNSSEFKKERTPSDADNSKKETKNKPDIDSKETIYKIAVGKYDSNDISTLTEGIVLLATIIDYNDSAPKIEMFREKISFISKIEADKKMYREQKRCQHCGGNFKGLFKLKCKECGKIKDY